MAKYSAHDLAESAYTILNELMGEIHGARMTGIIAIRKPEIFKTKYPDYIVRGSIALIVLSLRKYDDLWTSQVAPKLISDSPPLVGIELHEEIKKRKLRQFCNLVIAHYAERKVSPRTPEKKIEQLLIEQGFDTNIDFLEWTRGVIKKIEIVRDAIASKYELHKKRTKSTNQLLQ